jgi:hypothetical protein
MPARSQALAHDVRNPSDVQANPRVLVRMSGPRRAAVSSRDYLAFLTFLSGFSQRHALWRQLFEQGAGSLQIRGRKALGEPIIN